MAEWKRPWQWQWMSGAKAWKVAASRLGIR